MIEDFFDTVWVNIVLTSHRYSTPLNGLPPAEKGQLGFALSAKKGLGLPALYSTHTSKARPFLSKLLRNDVEREWESQADRFLERGGARRDSTFPSSAFYGQVD
jgi:hypothetical protein